MANDNDEAASVHEKLNDADVLMLCLRTKLDDARLAIDNIQTSAAKSQSQNESLKKTLESTKNDHLEILRGLKANYESQITDKQREIEELIVTFDREKKDMDVRLDEEKRLRMAAEQALKELQTTVAAPVTVPETRKRPYPKEEEDNDDVNQLFTMYNAIMATKSKFSTVKQETTIENLVDACQTTKS